MKIKLKNKIILNFLVVIFICILIIWSFSHIFLENKFKAYVIDKQQKNNEDILHQIQNQYSSQNGWNVSSVEDIGVDQLSNGIIIKLKDVNNNTIWDATKHNSGLCAQMLDHMAKNMQSKYPNFNGKYLEEAKDIYVNNQKIATLYIGYYGPFFYTDNDLAFINQLNLLLLISASISIVISIILAIIFSRNITKSLEEIIDKTHKLSQGKYDLKIDNKSNVYEISNLLDSINNLEKKLNSQEKLRKKLTQNMSHELRTPITSIQGHLEAMIDGIIEPTKERLESCYEEIQRMSRLIEKLENLENLEKDKILDLKYVDISLIMKNVLNNFEKQILDKKISLNFEYTPIMITIDPDKMYQVFVNIISNAIKYTNESGKISVKIVEKKGNIKIIVNDNGIGIDPKHINYIFERLYREDDSRNSKVGGYGIGLSIVKEIINLHHGDIEVKSKKNEGTTIEIILNK